MITLLNWFRHRMPEPEIRMTRSYSPPEEEALAAVKKARQLGPAEIKRQADALLLKLKNRLY